MLSFVHTEADVERIVDATRATLKKHRFEEVLSAEK